MHVNVRYSTRLLGASLACAGALVIATASSATAAPLVRPSATTVAPRATHVTLQLATAAVKPHTATEIVATVVPRVADRAVTLKMVVGSTFVGLARAMTNHAGEATLRVSFAHQAKTDLRAFVASTPRYQAAISPRVVELVATSLPIMFPAGLQLALGSTGPYVVAVQRRLAALGYWLGAPDGTFGDSTQQAVYAIQKVAGIPANGIVGATTVAAINKGVLPVPRTTSGNAIDVDLQRDLVMFVQNGKLFAVLNTSTGGGYTYLQGGVTNVAATPTGVYQMQRAVDGTVVDSLGSLWRPRFFYEGFALHGDSYVPPFPVSHGCVRISNEAIDWVWANNLAPLGSTVWVY